MNHRRYSLASVLRTLYCSDGRLSACVHRTGRLTVGNIIFPVYHPTDDKTIIQSLILLTGTHVNALNQKFRAL